MSWLNFFWYFSFKSRRKSKIKKLWCINETFLITFVIFPQMLQTKQFDVDVSNLEFEKGEIPVV